jgi:cephalosporin hydroxylase
VFKGGSLNMWREYFGPKATIFGIDINPDCATYATAPNQVRIGSQADPAFLKSVVDEMGAPDIILDDGSHFASHQRASFRALWPLLKDGGLYVIEDTHTSYWPGQCEGGYRRTGTAVELAKTLIDDMHGWYHTKGSKEAARDSIRAIHIYDSLFVVEKGKVDPPKHIMIGHDPD